MWGKFTCRSVLVKESMQSFKEVSSAKIRNDAVNGYLAKGGCLCNGVQCNRMESSRVVDSCCGHDTFNIRVTITIPLFSFTHLSCSGESLLNPHKIRLLLPHHFVSLEPDGHLLKVIMTITCTISLLCIIDVEMLWRFGVVSIC